MIINECYVLDVFDDYAYTGCRHVFAVLGSIFRRINYLISFVLQYIHYRILRDRAYRKF